MTNQLLQQYSFLLLTTITITITAVIQQTPLPTTSTTTTTTFSDYLYQNIGESGIPYFRDFSIRSAKTLTRQQYCDQPKIGCWYLKHIYA